jgi:hypothetical protein
MGSNDDTDVIGFFVLLAVILVVVVWSRLRRLSIERAKREMREMYGKDWRSP